MRCRRKRRGMSLEAPLRIVPASSYNRNEYPKGKNTTKTCGGEFTSGPQNSGPQNSGPPTGQMTNNVVNLYEDDVDHNLELLCSKHAEYCRVPCYSIVLLCLTLLKFHPMPNIQISRHVEPITVGWPPTQCYLGP